MATGWERAVRDAARYARSQAAEAVERYGAALGLSEDDVLWAMGMVSSRCLGDPPGMAPLVDLLNHSSPAMHPQWYGCCQ